jgi:hypothetical protein
MPVKPSSAKTGVATTLVMVAVGALRVPAVGASKLDAFPRLSLEYFHADFATRASHLAIAGLGQKIT